MRTAHFHVLHATAGLAMALALLSCSGGSSRKKNSVSAGGNTSAPTTSKVEVSARLQGYLQAAKGDLDLALDNEMKDRAKFGKTSPAVFVQQENSVVKRTDGACSLELNVNGYSGSLVLLEGLAKSQSECDVACSSHKASLEKSLEERWHGQPWRNSVALQYGKCSFVPNANTCTYKAAVAKQNRCTLTYEVDYVRFSSCGIADKESTCTSTVCKQMWATAESAVKTNNLSGQLMSCMYSLN